MHRGSLGPQSRPSWSYGRCPRLQVREQTRPQSAHLQDTHHDKQESAAAHDSAGVSAREREHGKGALHADSGEEERDPQPKAVGEGEKRTRPVSDALVESARTAASVGPMHGVQPTPNKTPSMGAPTTPMRGW